MVRMPTAEPLVPSDLAGALIGVIGLDDLARPVPELVHGLNSRVTRLGADSSLRPVTGATSPRAQTSSGPQADCSAMTGAGLSVGAGGGGAVAGTPGAVYDAGQDIVHIYVRSPGGHLVEYVSDHAFGQVWNAYDLTGDSGGPGVEGTPSPVVTGGAIQVYVGGS